MKALCDLALSLIARHPQLQIVEIEKNYHPQSGLYQLVWEKTRYVQIDTTFAGLAGRQMAVMTEREGTAIKVLDIIENTYDAIMRYRDTLR